MEKFINFIKKPIVWIVLLIAAVIGGIITWVVKARKRA